MFIEYAIFYPYATWKFTGYVLFYNEIKASS